MLVDCNVTFVRHLKTYNRTDRSAAHRLWGVHLVGRSNECTACHDLVKKGDSLYIQ